MYGIYFVIKHQKLPTELMNLLVYFSNKSLFSLHMRSTQLLVWLFYRDWLALCCWGCFICYRSNILRHVAFQLYVLCL